MRKEAENSFGDVSERVVTDFGCGCGALGVAAALLGAEQVIGIDIDAQSLEIAAENAVDLELVKRAALQSFNASSAEVICELRYDVPQLYKFHEKREVDIAV
ncbi:hypothetical protein DVH24_029317 [Malus domestica]|uniref:Methyltransferase small domain-containing protein n=1 Tax=Malus domestica TaxID=3750 RepID=A0A498HT33_MALDO|nr:hypothetical protein DVH24_029317 [Malus domestica]